MRGRSGSDSSPLETFEHDLKPWVAFFVVPVFVLANTGVSLEGAGLTRLVEPVSLGIVLGLVVGKPLGIMGLSWLALKTGLARLPHGVGMRHLLGVACLCGIGFTMSLFIGSLAFESSGQAYFTDVRIGILTGSLVSALLGYFVLRAVLADPQGAKPMPRRSLWSVMGSSEARDTP